MGGFKNCSWVQANNGGDEDPIALQRDVIGINISSVHNRTDTNRYVR